jgi:hypothetical protein
LKSRFEPASTIIQYQTQTQSQSQSQHPV